MPEYRVTMKALVTVENEFEADSSEEAQDFAAGFARMELAGTNILKLACTEVLELETIDNDDDDDFDDFEDEDLRDVAAAYQPIGGQVAPAYQPIGEEAPAYQPIGGTTVAQPAYNPVG